MGAEPVPEIILEQIVEHFEETCWENIQKLLQEQEAQAIEYDEDTICDVCRSPESEEGNEMVFCDSCNICVHQACYGITTIPSGSWVCRTCALGIKPDCVLCPNKGAAMKSTKSGQKWAHVSCALWIPEVSIGSVERMEPITKIPNIPQSRWSLVCVLCRERRGACIQCSVKTCKTAYHVTCAFKHGLEMRVIIEDENADDGVKLRSYCEKHSRQKKSGASEESDGEAGGAGAAAGGRPAPLDSSPSSTRKKKDLTSEQKNQARAAKLRQIETEFYKYVDTTKTSNYLDIDLETTEAIFYYWKLKRRSGFNKPLLTPRSEEIDFLCHQQDHDQRLKMFVQLRQYLERVRNLCYMVGRREKMGRSYLKTREQVFSKQSDILSSSLKLSSCEVEAVMAANKGPSVYDRLCSGLTATTVTATQFDKFVQLLESSRPFSQAPAAPIKSSHKNKNRKKKKDVNGLVRNRMGGRRDVNPYRKDYINGAEQRKSRSSSANSSVDTDSDSLSSSRWMLPNTSRIPVFTSSEDDIPINNRFSSRHQIPTKPNEKTKKPSPKKVPSNRGRKPNKSRPITAESSLTRSSDDEKVSKDFDALLQSKASPVKSKKNSASSISRLLSVRNPLFESSEDETEITIGTGAAGKSRKKKKGPQQVKEPVPGSSGDEKPVVNTPSKRGGRAGRSKATRGAPVSPNLAAVKTNASSDEDDDDLPRPTYKLTTDEENSNDKVSDVYDLSDVSVKSGSDRVAKRESEEEEYCVSDCKDGVSDAHNSAILKTKAAMKEFTPKIEEKPEKVIKKKDRRAQKVKSDESEAPNDSDGPDLSLFVPQRAAARKASELITSHNVGGVSTPTAAPAAAAASVTAAVVAETVAETSKKPRGAAALAIAKETTAKEEAKSPEKSPMKSKRGRPPKDRSSERAELRDEPDMAVKKSLFEAQEILHYVPMRQAAMKAAQNFKNKGPTTTVPTIATEEAPPVLSVTTASVTSGAADPVITPSLSGANKGKRAKPEARVNAVDVVSNKSPRLRRSARSTPSHSDSDSESQQADVKRVKREANKEKAPRSMFSESEDEILPSLKKDKSKTGSLFGSDKSPENKQLFRGEVYLHEYQSSSENDEEKDSRFSLSNIKASNTSSVRKSTAALGEKRSQRNHVLSSVRADHLRREVENQEPDAGTLRKAPDKKLKTSEGRPEHGFQPPALARSESPRVRDPVSPAVRDLVSPAVRGSRVCQAEREPRDADGSGRGDTHEPLPGGGSRDPPPREDRPSRADASHSFSPSPKPTASQRANFPPSPALARVSVPPSPQSPVPAPPGTPPPAASPLRLKTLPSSAKEAHLGASSFPPLPAALKPREELQSTQDADRCNKPVPAVAAPTEEERYSSLSCPQQKEAPLRTDPLRSDTSRGNDPRDEPSVPPSNDFSGRPNSRMSGLADFIVKDLSPQKRMLKPCASSLDALPKEISEVAQSADEEPKNSDDLKDVRFSCEVSSKEKVEQPKDSGYKSAITTPEPVDRLDASRLGDNRMLEADVGRLMSETQPVGSNDVRTSSANSDYGSNGNSSVSGISSSSSSSNSCVVAGEVSPLKSLVSSYDGKINKSSSSSRRKNLTMVIDDMTKKATSDLSSRLSSPTHHTLSSLSPLHPLLPAFASPHHIPAAHSAMSPRLPSSPHIPSSPHTSHPLPETSIGQLLPTSVLTTCADADGGSVSSTRQASPAVTCRAEASSPGGVRPESCAPGVGDGAMLEALSGSSASSAKDPAPVDEGAPLSNVGDSDGSDTANSVASFKQRWRGQFKPSPPRSSADGLQQGQLTACLAQLQHLPDYQVQQFLDIRNMQQHLLSMQQPPFGVAQPLFNPFLPQEEFMIHRHSLVRQQQHLQHQQEQHQQQLDSQQKLMQDKQQDMESSLTSDISAAESSELTTPKKFPNSFVQPLSNRMSPSSKPDLPPVGISMPSDTPKQLNPASSIANFAPHSSNFGNADHTGFHASINTPSSKPMLIPGRPSESPCGLARAGALSPHKTPSSVAASEEEIVVDNESPLATDRVLSPPHLLSSPAVTPQSSEPCPVSLSAPYQPPAPSPQTVKQPEPEVYVVSSSPSKSSGGSSPFTTVNKSLSSPAAAASGRSVRSQASKMPVSEQKNKTETPLSSPQCRVLPITISLTGGGSTHASPSSHHKISVSPALSSPRSSRRLQEAAAAVAKTPVGVSDVEDISPSPLTIVSPKPSTPHATPRSVAAETVYDVTDESDVGTGGSKTNTPAATPTAETNKGMSPLQRRVPIYKMAAKGVRTAASPEKKSPRAQAVSPRWIPKEEVKKRVSRRSNQSGGKGGRGRGNSSRAKGRGRQSKVAVPKELVGTVYDFDFDDEFSDTKSNNQSTLDDLRMLREKRQSVDAPQPPTPTYAPEIRETPMPSYKKASKDRKGKGKEKESSPKQNDKQRERSPYGESALHSLPQQSPKNIVPPVKISSTCVRDDSKMLSSDSHYVLKNSMEYSTATYTATPSVRPGSDDRTNILKLKIKGPYANASTASPPVPPPEPEPSFTNSFRRMRKKELIRQYCNQDQNPPASAADVHGAAGLAIASSGGGLATSENGAGGVSGGGSGSGSVGIANPPPQKRAAIFIPKAVASMPTIPTREDYKRYRNPQEDGGSSSASTAGGRRRRRVQDASSRTQQQQQQQQLASEKPDETETSSRKRVRSVSKEEEDNGVMDALPPAKLRISLSKKGSKVTRVSESSTVANDTPAVDPVTVVPAVAVNEGAAVPDSATAPVKDSTDMGRLRPPKKRLPEEHSFEKIRNDSLRYREEIMNTFSKRGKKRKHRDGSSHSSGSEMKDDDVTKSNASQSVVDNDVTDVTVISNESRKLVLRFSKSCIKTEPPDRPLTPTPPGSVRGNKCGSGNSSGNEAAPEEWAGAGGDETTTRSGRKSSRSNNSDDNANGGKSSRGSCGAGERTEPPQKMMPLKLKLQRRPDGYTSAHPSLPGYSLLGQGPGPPVSQPLDPPPALPFSSADALAKHDPTPNVVTSNYDNLSSILRSCSADSPPPPLDAPDPSVADYHRRRPPAGFPNCVATTSSSSPSQTVSLPPPHPRKNNNNNNNRKNSFHSIHNAGMDHHIAHHKVNSSSVADFSDDVLQRLEEQLAASDGGGGNNSAGGAGSNCNNSGGGVGEGGSDSHHEHHHPNHTYKENSNAR